VPNSNDKKNPCQAKSLQQVGTTYVHDILITEMLSLKLKGLKF